MCLPTRLGLIPKTEQGNQRYWCWMLQLFELAKREKHKTQTELLNGQNIAIYILFNSSFFLAVGVLVSLLATLWECLSLAREDLETECFDSTCISVFFGFVALWTTLCVSLFTGVRMSEGIIVFEEFVVTHLSLLASFSLENVSGDKTLKHFPSQDCLT